MKRKADEIEEITPVILINRPEILTVGDSSQKERKRNPGKKRASLGNLS